MSAPVIRPVFSQIQIPESELEFTYVRSSGPGGQNVNKVNSKAVLRWNLAASSSLSPEAREFLHSRLVGKLTVEGDLVITSDRYRDQIRNRADCKEKFDQLISTAVAIQKRRKKTKPSRSSERKRIEQKKMHSNKKNLRRSGRGDF